MNAPTPLNLSAAIGPLWRVRLLGGLQADGDGISLTQFGSRSAGALLARLAMSPQRSHAREELIELLWPGVDLAVGRNRLRQTLFGLRQLLEPAGAASPPVLVADRLALRVVDGALACDVTAFEHAIRHGRYGDARACYRGELMPGFYDDWIAQERLRLAALAERLDDEAPAASVSPGRGRDDGLPVYMTRGFGLDAPQQRLLAALREHRLVCVLGPGGSGKTRLAVALATSLRDRPAHAATPVEFDLLLFVPLVTCAHREGLLDALRAGLNADPRAADPLAAIVTALSGRRALLVLDNFEHLIASAADVVARLTATLPALRVLVTSRKVLGLDGEREFALAPLALPEAGMGLAETAANPAVAMFIDRARLARPAFEIDAHNGATVIALVHCLAGMPLALELAASRIRSLSPGDMLGLLQGDPQQAAARQPQLALLERSGPRGGLDPRHASMHRVVEWSWRQLEAPQAELLAALTVFRGGFTGAAAQAVCGRDGQALGLLLDELAMHSLLHTTHELHDGVRFGIYEPIREFAAAFLDEAAARTLRARHRAWLIAWGEAFGPTPPLRQVRREIHNLVAGLASAVADDASDEALQIALAMRHALTDVVLPVSALAWLAGALQPEPADRRLAARSHTLLARLFLAAGDGNAARAHADQGLALAGSEPALRARALQVVASVRWRSTRVADGLAPLLAEAFALAEAQGDLEVQASVHALRAYIANIADRDHATGERLHGLALALWERLGNAHAANSGRYNLALCALHRGRRHEALSALDAVAAHAHREADWHQLSQALNVQGEAWSALRRWPEALAAYRACIRVAWENFEQHALAFGLWNLPRALAHQRLPEAAAQLAGFAAHFWTTRFGPLNAAEQRELQRVQRLAAAQIGAAAARTAWQTGERLGLADAVTLALGPSGEAAFKPSGGGAALT